MCKIYREKANPQASTLYYPYMGCLAFVAIYICDKKICSIAGYLKYSESCLKFRLQNDLPYRLLLYIKNSIENLLNLNVQTSDILAQNAKIVKNIFDNHTIIGYNRTLLMAIDIVNIRKQMFKKNWDINIQTDAAKNLEWFLGPNVEFLLTPPNADQLELKDACLYYQSRTEETDHLEIIICSHEQQQYTWKYGHQNLILVDGTFGLILSEYDSKILEHLFTIFRDKISNIYNKDQEKENINTISVTFSPLVAMTDTDVKKQELL
ncbi:sugar transporter [Gigaspora margarita]|uniref:Sugar transporter n=1 Tax=Gigaspora margarita TaxID=4874 RepID=A0A8H3X5Y2_GIGMA|nr:sugar transporter [Gigaspora margarita]